MICQSFFYIFHAIRMYEKFSIFLNYIKINSREYIRLEDSLMD